jgi:hypothetical protein
MCKKKYSLIHSFIDKNQYDYVNKVKLKVWKELETKRLIEQLNTKEELPHITTNQLNDAIENRLFSDFNRFNF